MSHNTLTPNQPSFEKSAQENIGAAPDTPPEGVPPPALSHPEGSPADTITAARKGGLPPRRLESPEPFYALDEDAIRSRIVEILTVDSSESPEHPSLFYMPDLTKTRDQSDGRMEYKDKARVMAEIENRYWEQAQAKWKQAEGPGPTGDESLKDVFKMLNPLRLARGVFRTLKAGADIAIIEKQAAAAIQIAGERYDALLAAAAPFTSKLEEATNFLNNLPLPKPAPEAAKTEVEQPNEAAVEELVQDLKLDEQLAEQAAIWSQAGILKPIDDKGTLGTETAEGQQCPMPSRQLVRDVVGKQTEFIRYKASQGFTRMIIVPTGATTDQLNKTLASQVVAQHQAGNLQTVDGRPVHLDETYTPADRQKELTVTEKLAQEKEDTAGHGRKQKEATPGWEILFVRNRPEIARRREDLVFMGDRPEFLSGARPAAYEKILRKNAKYKGETGLSLREWYAYAITEVARTGTLVDFEGRTFLLGSEAPRHAGQKMALSVGWSFAAKSRDPRLVINRVKFNTRFTLPEESMRTVVVLSTPSKN